MRSIITSFIFIFCFLASNTLSSQKISIQGTLKDINGKAVPDNQSQSVTFKIYDAVTGGNVIWTKDTTVAVNGGVYSHYLGGNPALTGEMFTGSRWLSVTVNGVELTPRTELSYAPYALSVSSAQTALGISKSNSSIAIESDGDMKIMLNTTENLMIKTDGKVGIGTSSPASKLDIEGGLGIGANYSGSIAAPSNGAIIEGNVGIGTNSPDNKLDVAGGIAIGSSYAGSNTAPANGVIIQGNVGIGTSTPDPDKSLVINNNSTTNWLPIIEFDKGMSDPNFKLVVKKGQSGSAWGTIISQFGMMYDDGGTTHDNAMIRFHRGDGATGGFFSFTAGDNTEVVRISNNHGGSGETRWFSKSNDIQLTSSGNWDDVSLKVEGDLWVNNGAFYATSDERIKRDITLTHNKKDLEILNKIQISNYLFKDVNTHGHNSQKKVIAQQVNSVYPTAISKNKGVIPNVYELASRVEFKEQSTFISTNIYHDFAKGDRVKLILKDSGVKEVIVKEIVDNNTFIIDEKIEGEVFVYGKEVDDLLNVDYDALSMLNISATQELYKRIVALEDENNKLKTENKTLNDKQAKLENRLDKVETFMKSIKASTSSVD